MAVTWHRSTDIREKVTTETRQFRKASFLLSFFSTKRWCLSFRVSVPAAHGHLVVDDIDQNDTLHTKPLRPDEFPQGSALV